MIFILDMSLLEDFKERAHDIDTFEEQQNVGTADSSSVDPFPTTSGEIEFYTIGNYQ